MQTALRFAAITAAALRSSPGFPAGVSVHAHHALPERLERPALAVLVEDIQNRHTAIFQGTLVLRYLSDADEEHSATAADNLATPAAWLCSSAGRSALQSALSPAGIWLRVISPVSLNSQEDGDRTRAYDQRFNVWLQVEMP